jgi:DNA-binding transcriptional ArsR family regulator
VSEPKPPPDPPHPDLHRRPSGPFGWLDARLLHEGWLARLGPEATAVLVLLALAADRRGASYYGREKMGSMTGLERREVDRALASLRAAGLVDQRPWHPGHPDGVWQLLPLPKVTELRGCEPTSFGEILATLAKNADGAATGPLSPQEPNRRNQAESGRR